MLHALMLTTPTLLQPVKEKPKRKGPLDAIPASSEDWSTYDAPDEVIEAFKQEAMKTSGINQNTIPKPVSHTTSALSYVFSVVSPLVIYLGIT